ncbi:hypothetical protein QJS66_21550 [Kocuria rhizophila]|nr:hypothetical protein QJS66_21550 [Kocuria rhizophila]
MAPPGDAATRSPGLGDGVGSSRGAPQRHQASGLGKSKDYDRAWPPRDLLRVRFPPCSVRELHELVERRAALHGPRGDRGQQPPGRRTSGARRVGAAEEPSMNANRPATGRTGGAPGVPGR